MYEYESERSVEGVLIVAASDPAVSDRNVPSARHSQGHPRDLTYVLSLLLEPTRRFWTSLLLRISKLFSRCVHSHAMQNAEHEDLLSPVTVCSLDQQPLDIGSTTD